MAVFFKRLMSCHCQINKTNQLLTYMDNFRNSIPDWAFGMNCAVTVCDADGVILYMNEKALETFASRGDMRGRNLFPCHNERSKSIMRRMLDTGESNTYINYQAWTPKDNLSDPVACRWTDCRAGGDFN